MAHRSRRLAAGIVVSIAAALALWPTASAGADAVITAQPLAHPEEDYAGSQISKYEDEPHRDLPKLVPGQHIVGTDVSSHQGNVDWAAVARNGAMFSYIKATEGVTYINPYFNQQYNGSHKAGLAHGAYHFALPDRSDGVAQANYFVDHGGKWVRDGTTLPPVVDMEYNPYGDVCYKLSAAGMVGWVKAFSNQVHQRTGRYPMIYTSFSWWKKCTGNSDSFAKTNPLWIARYNKEIGPLPQGWSKHTMWQFADAGPFPGDQNTLNGPLSTLTTLARG